MFNFFNEIKEKFEDIKEDINDYKIINFSNKIIYVEGQKGIISITEEIINFKIYKGVINIEGTNLKLKECTNNTLAVSGNIVKVERQ